MSRVPVQLLYALAFGVGAFAIVWTGHEGILMLSPGSYIRSGDRWVDLQFHHVVPLAWKAYVQNMLLVTAGFGLISLAWAGLVAFSLRNLRSGLQPICAYLMGALGGIILYMLVTTQGLFVPASNPYPYLSATVLGMGSASYALCALRMNRGWLPRLGDLALVLVSVLFSMGWSFFLMHLIE